MVETILSEQKLKEIEIPEIKIRNKENIDQLFKLLLAGTPKLKFSIEKQGKELYKNIMHVEMR
jgi:hypothetical protein